MTDILIIGGGVAGLGVAAELAPHAKVTLIEAEPAFTYHASGRSAAIYLPGYGNAAVRVLNDASALGLRAAGVLSPRGVLLLGAAGDEADLRTEAATMGIPEIPVARAQALLPILDPDRITCAAWTEDALAIDTDALCQHYLRRARAAGADLRTRAPAQAIRREGGLWHVTTPDGEITAQRLVNAAGAWVDGIARMAGVRPLGFQPLRRSMAVLPAPGGHDVSSWPFTLFVRDAWYAKPEGGRWLVSPSEEDPAEPHDAFADDMVIAEGLARYEAAVNMPVTRVETTWAGLRTMAPDRTLVLGPDPEEPDFIWCAGQGGYGFQSAPAASKLLADRVLGRSPDLLPAQVEALSPSRFA